MPSEKNMQQSIYLAKWNGETSIIENVDEEKFIFEFDSQDWDNILVSDRENVSETIDNYLQNLNNLLQKHAPLKKWNKQERKFQRKHWITKGLQVSIKKKNSIFRKYIRRQNKILKKDLHLEYKNYTNLLPTLLKDSKHSPLISRKILKI